MRCYRVKTETKKVTENDNAGSAALFSSELVCNFAFQIPEKIMICKKAVVMCMFK